jgi:hypothetical protein
MNIEIKAYRLDKSFFYKGIGIKAPLVIEFIKISDNKDNSIFTLLIK